MNITKESYQQFLQQLHPPLLNSLLPLLQSLPEILIASNDIPSLITPNQQESSIPILISPFVTWDQYSSSNSDQLHENDFPDFYSQLDLFVEQLLLHSDTDHLSYNDESNIYLKLRQLSRIIGAIIVQLEEAHEPSMSQQPSHLPSLSLPHNFAHFSLSMIFNNDNTNNNDSSHSHFPQVVPSSLPSISSTSSLDPFVFNHLYTDIPLSLHHPLSEEFLLSLFDPTFINTFLHRTAHHHTNHTHYVPSHQLHSFQNLIMTLLFVSDHPIFTDRLISTFIFNRHNHNFEFFNPNIIFPHLIRAFNTFCLLLPQYLDNLPSLSTLSFASPSPLSPPLPSQSRQVKDSQSFIRQLLPNIINLHYSASLFHHYQFNFQQFKFIQSFDSNSLLKLKRFSIENYLNYGFTMLRLKSRYQSLSQQWFPFQYDYLQTTFDIELSSSPNQHFTPKQRRSISAHKSQILSLLDSTATPPITIPPTTLYILLSDMELISTSHVPIPQSLLRDYIHSNIQSPIQRQFHQQLQQHQEQKFRPSGTNHMLNDISDIIKSTHIYPLPAMLSQLASFHPSRAIRLHNYFFSKFLTHRQRQQQQHQTNSPNSFSISRNFQFSGLCGKLQRYQDVWFPFMIRSLQHVLSSSYESSQSSYSFNNINSFLTQFYSSLRNFSFDQQYKQFDSTFNQSSSFLLSRDLVHTFQPLIQTPMDIIQLTTNPSTLVSLQSLPLETLLDLLLPTGFSPPIRSFTPFIQSNPIMIHNLYHMYQLTQPLQKTATSNSSLSPFTHHQFTNLIQTIKESKSDYQKSLGTFNGIFLFDLIKAFEFRLSQSSDSSPSSIISKYTHLYNVLSNFKIDFASDIQFLSFLNSNGIIHAPHHFQYQPHLNYAITIPFAPSSSTRVNTLSKSLELDAFIPTPTQITRILQRQRIFNTKQQAQKQQPNLSNHLNVNDFLPLTATPTQFQELQHSLQIVQHLTHSSQAQYPFLHKPCNSSTNISTPPIKRFSNNKTLLLVNSNDVVVAWHYLKPFLNPVQENVSTFSIISALPPHLEQTILTQKHNQLSSSTLPSLLKFHLNIQTEITDHLSKLQSNHDQREHSIMSPQFPPSTFTTRSSAGVLRLLKNVLSTSNNHSTSHFSNTINPRALLAETTNFQSIPDISILLNGVNELHHDNNVQLLKQLSHLISNHCSDNNNDCTSSSSLNLSLLHTLHPISCIVHLHEQHSVFTTLQHAQSLLGISLPLSSTTPTMNEYDLYQSYLNTFQHSLPLSSTAPTSNPILTLNFNHSPSTLSQSNSFDSNHTQQLTLMFELNDSLIPDLDLLLTMIFTTESILKIASPTLSQSMTQTIHQLQQKYPHLQCLRSLHSIISPITFQQNVSIYQDHFNHHQSNTSNQNLTQLTKVYPPSFLSRFLHFLTEFTSHATGFYCPDTKLDKFKIHLPLLDFKSMGQQHQQPSTSIELVLSSLFIKSNSTLHSYQYPIGNLVPVTEMERQGYKPFPYPIPSNIVQKLIDSIHPIPPQPVLNPNHQSQQYSNWLQQPLRKSQLDAQQQLFHESLTSFFNTVRFDHTLRSGQPMNYSSILLALRQSNRQSLQRKLISGPTTIWPYSSTPKPPKISHPNQCKLKSSSLRALRSNSHRYNHFSTKSHLK